MTLMLAVMALVTAAGRIPRLKVQIIRHWNRNTIKVSCSNLQSIVPFLSLSASLIISSISASVRFSPSDFMTWRSSSAEMVPLPSLSKTSKAARVSCAKSCALTVVDIILRNSGWIVNVWFPELRETQAYPRSLCCRSDRYRLH